MEDFSTYAETLMRWCDELGNITQSPGVVDRRYLTNEHQQANLCVANWMTNAGMTTWQDTAGNQWGRYPSDDVNAPRFLMGSHLDTVPNGGKYDGMLGVLAPVALLQYCNDNNVTFPFHIDVVGFGDEEGTRFGATLLGSRALTNNWPQTWRNLSDDDGVDLPSALTSFGSSFDAIGDAALNPQSLLGYLETHIEQGPVLEQKNLPVGWVNAIAGAKRLQITVTGFAGHAGTVPMGMRQDALTAASSMILAAEDIAKARQVVATVGHAVVHPNAVNVIPGKLIFTLDIRSDDDLQRDQALEQIMQRFASIAQQRNVKMEYKQIHNANAVKCSSSLSKMLSVAITQAGIVPVSLPSGAGHDAMEMARICPVSMLFVRCLKGISHHPAESIITEDAQKTLTVLWHFLQLLSTQQQGSNG